ncbi:unnamed protein product, partial [Meganyctiphanes norvegica]
MSSADVHRRSDIGGIDPSRGTPFYAPPPRCQKTSVEIIREARAALATPDGRRSATGGSMGVAQRKGVRTVNTKRPFTPRERERTLFSGSTSAASRAERPPSSFTLSPLHFDSNDSSGRGAISNTMINRFSSEIIRIDDGNSKLPTLLVSSARRVQRHQFRAMSLDDLPEEKEESEEASLSHRKAVLPPPRSMSFNNMQIESVTEEPMIISHTSSPSPESRPTNDQQAQCVADDPGLITENPLRREFQDPNNLKNGTRSWNDNLEGLQTDTPRTSGLRVKSGHRRSRGNKSISKRPGISRNWRHAAEGSDPDTKEGTENLEMSTPQVESQPLREAAVDQPVYFEEKISPVLDEINRAVKCGVSEEVLGELVAKLYGILEAGGLLGRHFKYRSQVLRTVFRLVDREYGPLLANIARVMLALKVSGSNLTSVCKLVFKVTRHDTNDILFLESNLLDLLLEAVACVPPLELPEAQVYGYGALKFLTMNSQLVLRLLNRGILELLVLHMKLIVNHQQENGSVPEQTNYALVQLTGTLRNVSSCERTFPLLLMTGAVPQICGLLMNFVHDQDITSNVVRILSIISTHEECCAAAASHPSTLPAAVAALRRYSSHPAIVVRLAYALGNMMANSDEARWQLFSVEGFTETLLELLTEYLKKDREHQADGLDGISNNSGTPEDVMVKMIRVLANVSVHPRVGPVLARSRTCLSLLVSVLRHKAVEESEELVLSVLAMLNNLTFYTRDQPLSSLHTELAECLCDMLPMEHIEGLVETIRVFGNLTHFREVRDILTKRAVLEVLVEMLDCDSRELVYVCVGVLVNLMSDASRRSIFQTENGVLRMIDVLQYFGYGDWQLCSLACQVLWNYCASAADVQAAIGEKETEKLIYVLEEFLDDDSYFNNVEVFGECDPDTKDVVYQLWEEFAHVATKLLDRIEDQETSLPIVG